MRTEPHAIPLRRCEITPASRTTIYKYSDPASMRIKSQEWVIGGVKGHWFQGVFQDFGRKAYVTNDIVSLGLLIWFRRRFTIRIETR